jgi:probable addiction module antidote protein
MNVRLVDAGKYRNDAKAIAEYLNAAFSTGDSLLIISAIRAMVHAQGLARFSRKAGMTRDVVGRTFAAEESPAFDTVLKLLFALDVRLAVAAIGTDEDL